MDNVLIENGVQVSLISDLVVIWASVWWLQKLRTEEFRNTNLSYGDDLKVK
jgi:hypothetical protein